MKFVKMNGLGNDFIILNNLEEKIPPEQLPRLAKRLCHRQFSVGADGLMVVEAAKDGGDFSMIFLNSDGSYGEMCGNGARCLCRYGFEAGLSGAEPRIETAAGLVTGQRLSRRIYRIALNLPDVVRLGQTVPALGRQWRCDYVELGNPGIPHAVVPMEQVPEGEPLLPLGAALRSCPAFPRGANVNFYTVLQPDELSVKTYERGVEGFTLACGTGVGSTVAALTLAGAVSGQQVLVHVPGGDLTVDAEAAEGAITHLYLTGATTMVCAGEVFDDEEDSHG